MVERLTSLGESPSNFFIARVRCDESKKPHSFAMTLIGISVPVRSRFALLSLTLRMYFLGLDDM